jgi:Flp pilus assembly protein TadG
MNMLVDGFRKSQSGAIAVIGAITIGCLIATTALAVTYADAYNVRSKTQQALDAAVLAAAALGFGATDAERIATAKSVYKEVRVKKIDSAAALNIVGGTDPNFRVSNLVVYGDVDFAMASPFIRALGKETVAIGVNSAARKRQGMPACVIGLDPTESETMDFNGKASLEVDKCATQANSIDGTGMRQVGQPHMKAAEIGVTGGYSGTSYEPPPITGTTPILDPFASLPEPPLSACHPLSGAKLTNESRQLSPGTYCGGIDIMAGSSVTLSPGIYVMKDGPLTIQSGGAVTGNEVMIAFLGESSTLYMYGQAVLNVTSPKSGTFANIQFFGDRNVYGRKSENLWFTVIGNSQLTYDGALYAPKFHLWFAGGSKIQGSSPNYIAIAKKLWFQDNTRVEFEFVNKRNLDVPEAARLEYGAALYR